MRPAEGFAGVMVAGLASVGEADRGSQIAAKTDR
jgi:hypothetical protein